MNTRKKLKKIGATIIVLLLTLFSCACSPVQSLGSYANYHPLLNLFLQKDDTQEQAFMPPNVYGFSLLFDIVFDWALPFGDGYSFVVYENSMHIVGTDGAIEALPHFAFSTVKDGRYLFSYDGVYVGLMDIDGTVIIEPQFESVDFIGKSAIARINDVSFIFNKGGIMNILIGGVTLIADNVLLLENASLVNSDNALRLLNVNRSTQFKDKIFNLDYGLYNSVDSYNLENGLYDCKLNPLYAEDYMVCGYTDGMLIITDGDFYGLSGLDLSVKIKPFYNTVSYCTDKFAVFNKDESSIVIDYSGNEILNVSDKIVYYDGVYSIYKKNGVYFIADKNLNPISDKSFDFLASFQAVSNGFLILSDKYDAPLYSINDDEFYLHGYTNISVDDGIIIAQNKENNSYSVFDYSLNELAANLTSAQFSNGILTIETQEKFLYYKKSPV